MVNGVNGEITPDVQLNVAEELRQKKDDVIILHHLMVDINVLEREHRERPATPTSVLVRTL